MCDDLNNTDLYKEKLTIKDVNYYTVRYVNIVKEFLELGLKYKYKVNIGFHKYVIMKGLETLNHIYCYILLHTSNIQLATSHSQKAFYYYIEFIEQISKDEHYFLKFNVKDAVLFIYKKTIYDINNTYIQNNIIHADTKEIIQNVRHAMHTWDDIILSLCNDPHVITKENINALQDHIQSLSSTITQYVYEDIYHTIIDNLP